MPVMSKTGRPGIPQSDIAKMIETIELYLQQTREVLDRIEGHIKDLKMEHRIGKVKEEMHSSKKDLLFRPAKGL